MKVVCQLANLSILQNYIDLVVETKDDPAHYQPRNRQQVKYFHGQGNRKMSKDSFTALHEVAYMLPGFVWLIQTFPDLMVCCGQQDAIDYMQLNREPILLSYDTTFNLGNFYLSVLIMQCSFLSETPLLPLAFILHDRKFESVHSTFFSLLLQKLPLKKCIIVTDGEAGITRAIVNTMSNWTLVSCSNHILRDAEFWLKKHAANSADLAVYKNNVRELLQCSTAIGLQLKLQTLRNSWSAAFAAYYDAHLKRRVEIGYGGYLNDCGLDDSSITNNMSESFNAVIKRYQVRK